MIRTAARPRSLRFLATMALTMAMTLPAGLAVSAATENQTLPPLDRLLSRKGIPRDQVQVRLVTGTVEWRRGPVAWQMVSADQFFLQGDELRTGAKGMLVLELPLQAGFVNVLAGSVIGVSEMRQLPGFDGPQTGTLVLNRGKAFVRLRKFNRKMSRFRVNSPNGSAVVRGTEFVVAVAPETRTTTVGVTTGLVQVQAKGIDTIVDVAPGNTTQIVNDAAPTAVVASVPTPIRLRRFLPRGEILDIVGTAAPGSSIVINGIQALVDVTGKFSATVPLGVGASQVTIEALEPTGHVETLSVSAGK